MLTYRVESGFDLDQYLWYEDNPLDFSIDISDHLGPVDQNGAPATGHVFHGATSLLTLRAFDVDEISGEIDRVVVNGVQLEGQLSGADNQWATDTFSFPAELLRFPAAEGEVATNQFQVLIDEGRSGWAVEVDWAELRPGQGRDGVRPVAFVHGITANESTWSSGESTMASMKKYFTDNQSRLVNRAIAPQLSKNDSIRRNVELLTPEVDDLIDRDPYQQIDIVGHSMGGLAGRLYAFDNPGKVRRIVMLGTPNAGSDLASLLCANRNTPWWLKGGGQYLVDYLSRDFGPCESSEDGLYQLQPGYVIGVFNKEVPDRASVAYGTIAGSTGGPGFVVLAGQDDGTVAVSSVRHLAAGNGNGGLHTSLTPSLETDHMGLIYERESGSYLRAFCFLYAEHADCAGTAGGGGGGGGGGGWRAAEAAAPSDEGAAVQNAGGAADAVGPGETRSYPLAAGAGEAATVVVLAEEGLAVSVDSGSFAPTTFFDAPAVAADFTGSATLTVTNEGDATRAFQAHLLVESSRALALDVPTVVRGGTQLEVVAELAGALAGDAVELRITGEAGEIVSGQMTAAGEGRWTTTLTAPAEGSFNVTAWVEGEQPRTANVPLVVAAGGSVGDTFTESTQDDDLDGLMDHLDLTVPVRVDDAGGYRLAGRLVDADGDRVAEAGATGELAAGDGALTLRFDGRTIHDSARPGPWRLVDVTLSDADLGIVDIVDLGQTAAADPGAFEHDVLTVSGFADEPVDADGDGLYDVLRLSAQVTTEEAGTYAVNGKLVAQDGGEVGRAQTEVYLGAGGAQIVLELDGASIGASGEDGPYVLRDLAIYPLWSPQSGVALVDAHTTAPYLSAQFTGGTALDVPPVAQFTATVTDGLVVTLDGSASSDDQTVVEHVWDLGDGTTASGPLVEHRYATAGVFDVTLRVTDTAGQVGEQTQQVDVRHTCQGVPATIVATGRGLVLGTRGADVIVGTAGRDVIHAGEGDDLVCAGGGDDLVLGGRGADTLHGGDGHDVLSGEVGNDRLFGDAGNDTLLGGVGDDVLVGGAGVDLLVGGPGTTWGTH
ncbi:alpha/beta fold hydrolase [Cellulomonas wangsupingiae]|uniref:alpha/beta fold hydrolase n=1 Tax=Cellulomonas wangsupingiae TaxID=2968085 RepID=UPI0024E083C9|nr:alpha/beta fold hydrolase [Cellulomonas wangsupingiae]